jgi:hypothetical protein
MEWRGAEMKMHLLIVGEVSARPLASIFSGVKPEKSPCGTVGHRRVVKSYMGAAREPREHTW